MSSWPPHKRRILWAQGRGDKKVICWIQGEMSGGAIQGHEIIVARAKDEKAAKEIVSRLNAWAEIESATMGEISYETVSRGADAIKKRLRMMRLA